MRNAQKKMRTLESGRFAIRLVACSLVAGTAAYGNFHWNPITATEIDGEDVHRWADADNWADGDGEPQNSVPGEGDSARILTLPRAVVAEDADANYLGIGTDGREGHMEIRPGATFTIHERVDLSRGGSDGVIDIYGVLHYRGDRQVRLGMRQDADGQGVAILNLYDGGRLDQDTDTMWIGSYEAGSGERAGRAEVNIFGGDFQSHNIQFGRGSTGPDAAGGVFYVAGSGASNISLNRDWFQNDQGVLRVAIDDGGVAPIEVGRNVEFLDGAKLDVGFLDGAARSGAWDVMRWDGELTDRGLAFAEGIDEATWHFRFVDSSGDDEADTLRLYAAKDDALSDKQPLHLGEGERVPIFDTRTLPFSRVGWDGKGSVYIVGDAFARLAGREGDVVVGRGGDGRGTIEQLEGGVEIAGEAGLRLGQDGGSGVYRLKGGRLDLLERGKIIVGESGDGASEFRIAGGRIDRAKGVELGRGGAGHFTVVGSAADPIKLGSWHQGRHGTLHVRFDRMNEATPIKVSGDVRFAEGARLNVSTARTPFYGHRDIMTWEGELLDRELTLAEEVDTDHWDVEFVDTNGDGNADTLRLKSIDKRLVDWPMWRYDAARSAGYPEDRLAEDLHLQWVRELPAPKRAWPHQWDDRGKLDFDVSYTPVAKGGKLFVPSNVTDSVTAYNGEDGTEVWRFYADGPVRLAPAVWDGRVYFISDDGYLYCVDAKTGDLVWTFQAGPSDHRLLGNERIINFWAARGGPVIKEGTVYFAAGIFPLHGTFVYALDADTGEVEWVNDTLSSDYVAVPHSDAYGYGGISPQGYLAASEEKLVVALGRGESWGEPLYLDRRTGRVLADPPFRGKGGGGYAVHADGLGFQSNDMLRQRIESVADRLNGEVHVNTGIRASAAWSEGVPEDTHVFYKLAARGRLFFTTEDGRLYCFGPEEVQPREYAYDPEPLEPRSEEWSGVAQSLLERLGEQGLLHSANRADGYALVLGKGSGDLFRELLNRSGLHVVMVEEDADTVRALRDELVAAGLYGRRAAVIEADPAAFAVQPYLFSLVVSEDAEAAGIAADAAQLEPLLDRLRPYGGMAWLGSGDAAAMAEAAETAAVDRIDVEAAEDHLLAHRGGPLTGAGEWTHQYHDAANTLRSDDDRARLPLGVLWFGGPNNHNILPRHTMGPRPQVAGGRQVFLGVETIAARCVYTGRELWEREFPGVGHFYTNMGDEEQWRTGRYVGMGAVQGASTLGSRFVTLPDSVYLRYERKIYRLDPATGETLEAFELPGRSAQEIYEDEDAPEWGHLSVQGDYIIASIEPYIFYPDRKPGKGGDNPSGTSSRSIAVMNRYDGDVLWEREARIGFRHSSIISSEDALYLIDGVAEESAELLARRGKEPEYPSTVKAFELDTGNELWRTDSEVFGTFLLLSEEYDVLVEGGMRDGRGSLREEPSSVTGRSAKNGEILWEHDGGFRLPGAIHGDMLICGGGGGALSITTGERWLREQPSTGKRSAWGYGRTYGCGNINAGKHLLFFRSGYAGYFDITHDSGTGTFSGFRAGCTVNLIAADGVLNALDYTRTCTCSYALQTSLALVHMPDDSNIEAWTRYAGGFPDPEGYGLNFGAPGRRVNVAGDGRIWRDASGTARRHPSAIEDNGGGLDWVAASVREGEGEIAVDDLLDATYTVRLHFAELDEDVEAGDRVFDVYLDGEKVLEGFDVVEATGAPLRGAVETFETDVNGGELTIELRRNGDSERDPVIGGVDVTKL